MKEYKFKISGQDYAASVEELENGALNVTVNGKTYQVELPEKAHRPASSIVRPAAASPAAPTVARPNAAAPGNVVAPLPGTITCVKVQAGQKVKKGDVLVVMEAMKMANDITAEADGTIKSVCVSQGQSVNQGMTLVEFISDAPAALVAPAPKAAPTATPAAPKPADGANSVTAPLPGTVTQILVKVGDTVKAGDTVLMLEAMKMENSITAEAAGTVKAIRVEKGAQVQGGDVLIEMA